MAAAVGSCWVHLTSRHWTLHTGHTARLLILILSLFPLGGEQTFSIAGVPSPDGKSAAWRLNSKGGFGPNSRPLKRFPSDLLTPGTWAACFKKAVATILPYRNHRTIHLAVAPHLAFVWPFYCMHKFEAHRSPCFIPHSSWRVTLVEQGDQRNVLGDNRSAVSQVWYFLQR
jgi:hypothetical protein